MPPVHTVFGAATLKLRASRLGAMGSAWLLSVVTTRKRRLPPAKARRYIAALEKKIEEQQNTLRTAGDELRRKRFAYWNRSRY
jgi:hypothetical protein